MLKNYITAALRNLKRNPGFSLINIFGLSVGTACSLLILLYVREELSYDRFHEKAEHIHRLVFEENRSGTLVKTAPIFPIIGPLLAEEFPGIINAVRFERRYRPCVQKGEEKYIEERFFHADPHVFEVFDFPLKIGNPDTALKEPYSLLLTEKTAERYFGEESPMGKTLSVDGKDYRIQGILADIPGNSHIHFDFLASISTLQLENRYYGNIWGGLSAYTYLLFDGSFSPEELEAAIPGFLRKQRNEEAARRWRFFLQPLTGIHLRSHLNYEVENNGDIRTVYIFSAAALFLLFIACINFMNLSTARSSTRAKEVGLRKVLGADRIRLMKQFLGESVVMTFAALPPAIFLVEIFLRILNRVLGVRISFAFFRDPMFMGITAAVFLFVGLASGSYPAVFLSAFHPSTVLRGKGSVLMRGRTFRKILVVFQFSLSVILMVGTVVIFSQLDFFRNKKLGFNKKNVVVFSVQDETVRSQFSLLKRELLAQPGVLGVSASTALPGVSPGMGVFWPQGEGAAGEKLLQFRFLLADADFSNVFDIELKAGKSFLYDVSSSDLKERFLINETAAQRIGWPSPVGKQLETEGRRGKVIGVVKDFHFRSKHQEIEPLVIGLLSESRYIYHISVKISGSDIRDVMGRIQSVWEKTSSGRPFFFYFLDEQIDRLYRSEEILSRLFGFFAVLAVLIACLGLIGLASFTAERRYKEFGIRKVLGATSENIVWIFSCEFTKWVLLANLIGWPVAYIAARSWLSHFAYRIELRPWMFLAAGATALVTTWATTVFQALKAAKTRPVDYLRCE
ncbi:MAG: ABC transporter permease [Candidatus Aminicenantes bacterium]|nr:ABC transporter permease [Candidatus Aminicenantes bacterium]